MTIAPIIIEIKNKNAHLFYDIDFAYFKVEMTKLPGVEIVDSICFGNSMLIGVSVSCDDIKSITIIKRFMNFFIYRWKINKSEITANFDNKLQLIDYPNP